MAVIIVLVGTSWLVAETFFATGSVTVVTRTPEPALVASPTALHLEQVLLPTPATTADLSAAPTLEVTTVPVSTSHPVLAATPGDTPPPTIEPETTFPRINIILPAGKSYSPGDNIRAELDVRAVNGIGNVFWWVTTNDAMESVVIRDRHWCDNQSECRISEEFTDLPAGTFTISVAAFDSLNNSSVQDIQVFVE